jgi:hypothetical protein
VGKRGIEVFRQLHVLDGSQRLNKSACPNGAGYPGINQWRNPLIRSKRRGLDPRRSTLKTSRDGIFQHFANDAASADHVYAGPAGPASGA